MGRVTSQYPQLDGGVSHRPERMLRTDRLRAQLNMLYDPLTGLGRRPGTRIAGQAAAAGVYSPVTHRAFRTLIDGQRLTIHYKAVSSASGGEVIVSEPSGGISVAVPKAGDIVADSLRTSGASAICTLGDLVVMAPANYVPLYDTTYPWAVESNQRHHTVWVRGGAYSRAFTLSLLRGNQRLRVQYQTREASYPKVLDTSDLLPTDPEYSKKVNDRTNAYNSEATAWIAAALADIAPENIANKLARGLEQSGFLSTGATVTVVGSTIFINDPSIEEVEADDAGDGNLIRAVGNTVGAPELLTTHGFPGKVVKVRPGNSERGEVFYLKAVAKDASSDYSAVTWEETAGEVITPTRLFVYLAKKATGGYVYSSDLDWINQQALRSFRGPQASVAGDLLSNPPPDFFGQQVTALAVFQDRLLVCRKDGYVAMSQVGDYFNFFRNSAVTVVDTDPVAFYITGAVGDTVRNTLTYNGNLVLIGDAVQYTLPVSTAFTPTRNGAAAFSAVPGMNVVPPRLVGDSVFFCRYHSGYGSCHALRPGRVVESPYEVEITEEVSTLLGAPADVLVTTTPALVFVRDGEKLLVANYYHTQGAEKYAVHEWTFPDAGTLVSMTEEQGQLFLIFHREGLLVLEKMNLQLGATKYPPIDGYQPEVPGSVGRTYQSRAVLTSPRLSPEAGNITGTGLGSEGFSQQRLVVATMIPFFAGTSAARLTVSTQAGDRTSEHYVVGGAPAILP